MEALLKNETVRMKIKSLSPQVRQPSQYAFARQNLQQDVGWSGVVSCILRHRGVQLRLAYSWARPAVFIKSFIESLLDLYEQETEEMIDVIEESRMELRGDFLHFSDETKTLRAESRMLEERRKENGNDFDKYKKGGMSSRNSDSRLSYINEQENSKSIQDYKRRSKRRQLGVDESRSKSTDRPSESRSISVLSTRSLPTPVSSKSVEQEKDEVMQNLKIATHQNEVERQRQAELMYQRREKRRQQKQTTEEKALELLEKALLMDKKLAEKKQEQDQKLKERLEERKKQRERESAKTPVEINLGDIGSGSVSKTEKNEIRVKSASDRHRSDNESKKKDSSDRRKRDSSKDRQKDKKDKNSVYDFGDF